MNQHQHSPHVQKIRARVLGGLFFVAVVLGAGYFSSRKSIRPAPAPRHIPAIGPVAIEGKAGYVIDLSTGDVLYAKNADAALPLASLTKIMTALTVLGTESENSMMAIGKDDLNQEGDSSLFLYERWNLGNLLKLTLISSSNDGASAVAAAAAGESANPNAFIKMMNAEAVKLGLSSMYFWNATGLDIDPTRNGGYGSARDVSFLLADAIKTHPEIFEATALQNFTTSSESGFNHTVSNTDEAIPEIPGLIASKTGYTDLAGGNLTVAFDAGLGHPVIVTVLGSSRDGRFADVLKLADAAREAINAPGF